MTDTNEFDKIVKEQEKFESAVGKQEWYGREIKAPPSSPLVDDGSGKPLVLRSFNFAVNPQYLNPNFKGPKPNNQELFNAHWQQIRVNLWGDGWRWREDIPPRLVWSKDKTRYRIFITCEPRLGTAVVEKTRTLQELLPPKSLTKNS